MNRTDPEYQAIWQAKLDLAAEEFRKRTISDDMYRACLYSGGFRGADLRSEFRFQEDLRHDLEKHRSLDGKLTYL